MARRWLPPALHRTSSFGKQSPGLGNSPDACDVLPPLDSFSQTSRFFCRVGWALYAMDVNGEWQLAAITSYGGLPFNFLSYTGAYNVADHRTWIDSLVGNSGSIQTVPEPTSFAIISIGVLCAIGARPRRAASNQRVTAPAMTGVCLRESPLRSSERR